MGGTLGSEASLFCTARCIFVKNNHCWPWKHPTCFIQLTVMQSGQRCLSFSNAFYFRFNKTLLFTRVELISPSTIQLNKYIPTYFHIITSYDVKNIKPCLFFFCRLVSVCTLGYQKDRKQWNVHSFQLVSFFNNVYMPRLIVGQQPGLLFSSSRKKALEAIRLHPNLLPLPLMKRKSVLRTIGKPKNRSNLKNICF